MRPIISTAILLLTVALAIGATGAPGGRASAGATVGSRVEIIVSGRNVRGDTIGVFTLTGLGVDTGRSLTAGDVSRATRVMRHGAFEGLSPGRVRLKGRRDNLFLKTSGRYVAVTISGITTVVTTGTWWISGGTGAYRAWRGGGRFVSVTRDVRRPPAGQQVPDDGWTFDARYEGTIQA